MPTLTADKVIGNRLRVQEDSTLYLGRPNSGTTEILKAGRLTPPVFSWVEKADGVWWVFNEIGTPMYLKHQSSLDVVPDSGGAQYLPEDLNGGRQFDFGAVGAAVDLLSAKNVGRAIKVLLVLFVGFIGIQIYNAFT